MSVAIYLSDTELERIGRMPPKKTRAHHNHDAPRESPTDLTGVLELPKTFLREALQRGSASCDTIGELCNHGLVVTSSYSGTGTYEAVVHSIMALAALSLGFESPVVFYAASDISPVARSAIAAHPETSRPIHIFGDILDRIPSGVLVDLREIEARYLAMWADTKAELGSGSISAKTAAAWRDKHGVEFLQELIPIFNTIEFRSQVHCYAHDRDCPVSPRVPRDEGGRGYDGHMWTEGAGSTCCPWSTMPRGVANAWLDEATLPCLTWIFGLRYYQPDMFQHECVDMFPAKQIFQSILQGTVQDVPKCVYARPIPLEWQERLPVDDDIKDGLSSQGADSADEMKQEWWVFTVVFGPDDIGAPTIRKRRYSIGYWLPHIRPQSSSLDTAGFRGRFCRPLSCDASVYLNADTSRFEMHTRMLLSQAEDGSQQSSVA